MMAKEGKLLKRAIHLSIEVTPESTIANKERSILSEALAGAPLLEYRSWMKKGEYWKDFTYLNSSLTKQKIPLHRERRKRLDLPNYLKELGLLRRSFSLD